MDRRRGLLNGIRIEEQEIPYLTIVPNKEYSAKNGVSFMWITDMLSSYGDLYYCLDFSGDWKKVSDNTNYIFDLATHKAVSFKGNLTPPFNDGIGQFSFISNENAKIDLCGNLFSLVYGDEIVESPIAENYHFKLLFSENDLIINAEKLIFPDGFIANRECCDGMFEDCPNLRTAPKRICPIEMNQGSFSRMFYSCPSLISAPELSATTSAVWCYEYMFYGCTSLTKAPSELSAETLSTGCYRYMFYGCTSLTTAPILPAPTLVQKCYINMFEGCSSLNYIKALFTTTPTQTYTDK